MNIRQLMPEADRELQMTVFRKPDGALEPRSQKRLTKDGETVNVSLVVSPLITETGEVYAVASTERRLQMGGPGGLA